jgi:hypothetical protein
MCPGPQARDIRQQTIRALPSYTVLLTILLADDRARRVDAPIKKAVDDVMMRLLEPLQRFAHITVVTQVGSQWVVMGFETKLIAKGFVWHHCGSQRVLELHNGSQWGSRALLDHNGVVEPYWITIG